MGGLRLATATSITACMALKVERREREREREREKMIRAMHEGHSLPELFDREKYDLVENLKSL